MFSVAGRPHFSIFAKQVLKKPKKTTHYLPGLVASELKGVVHPICQTDNIFLCVSLSCH